jgi:ATP-dependent DNA helicase PIF1
MDHMISPALMDKLGLDLEDGKLSTGDMSLWFCFQHSDFKKQGLPPRPKASARIVLATPKIFCNPEEPISYEAWCNRKMRLHHAYFGDWEPSLFFDKEDAEEDQTFTEAYKRCQADEDCYCGHPKDDYTKHPSEKKEAEDDDDDDKSDGESVLAKDDDRPLDDAAIMAAQGGFGPQIIDPVARLGHREQDVLAENWEPIQDYDLNGVDAYLESMKKDDDGVMEMDTFHIKIESLGGELIVLVSETFESKKSILGVQRRLFTRVITHFKATISAQLSLTAPPPPLRINIDGTAGTGKSYLIAAITKVLNDVASSYNLASPVLRMAPSGIAAFNISGQTLHTALDVPAETTIKPLVGARLITLQTRLEPIKYLIIDEKSMVGKVLLGKSITRMKEASGKKDASWGGYSALIFGDFAQLPPVKDKALWSSMAGTKDPINMLGHLSYLSLMESVELTKIYRQQGEDPVSVQLRSTLANLRNDEITDTDFDFLQARVLEDLPPARRHFFDDALHLFPSNKEVDTFNTSRLIELRSPVHRATAIDSAGVRGKEKDESLVKHLFLMKQSRIILTTNLWTTKGELLNNLSLIDD